MEEDSKFEDSQDFLKFLFDQTPRTPELFIDLKKNGAFNLPSISFEEEEELHTSRIIEIYSAEIAASESKIASAKIDDGKLQTLNLTLPVIEGHEETGFSKLQTEADSSPIFFILDANSTDNSSSISFEKEEVHKRHQTEIYDDERKAAKTKIDSPKIDKDKHHTLKFTLELSRGKKKTDVSKLKTKANSDPEKSVLDMESMPESGFIQQRNVEQKAMHARIQKDVFKSTTSSKPQIKISNGKRKFETCNNKSKISSVLPRPNIVKFEISSEGWKKAPLTELQYDEMQISFSSKFQESLKNKTCKNSSSSAIFCQKWRAIKPKSPNDQCQTLTKYLQTKSKEDQKFMPLKVTNKRHQTEEISQLRKKSCRKAATSNSPNKLCKASLYEESKKYQDEISESLVIQSEAFQNVLPSDSSKMEDKNYKNTRSFMLKNKTCINASSSGMCEKDCLLKKSLDLPNEPCQIIEGSSQTKSKEGRMLIQAKKRFLTGEISQLQKKLCHNAAMFELQNEMCKTPLVEQLKINQNKISESLVMQNETFQNVFLSDSSKMKDKNYKNARSSLSKNKTSINASSSGMCEKDFLLKKSLNLPNEPCHIIEGSSQTKSKEGRMLIQAKKRFITGEISQLQKKLCHNAAMFELQNEMCKTPLVEQLKIKQDQISESLVMQNEDFQNVFLSDSSKMKDKNYKSARSSLSKNKTSINASSSGMCEKDFLLKKSLNLPNEPCHIIEGSSQTKSKEGRMLIQAKKRFITGEISQLQKKLCHNAAMFELQNEMCKKPLVEQLKINQDQISESLVMQNEDFQNVFLSDSSKNKDKNYKNTRFSLSKNKTCKNASSSSMCDKDCQVIKPLNPPNTPCQNLEEYPQTKSKENKKFMLAKKRYLTGEIPQLQKKLCHETTTFEPKNKMRKTPLDEQLKTTKDQTSESFVLQSEGFFLSANSSKMQGENYKIAESLLLENKACKNASSSSVCEKCCQAIKPSNPPDEKRQTLKKTSQTKSKEEQSTMPSELIKKQHQTEEISQLEKKCQKATTSKSQNKLYKISLTQRPEMNHGQISVMQTEDVKSIFPSDTSKMENENSKNAESLLLKNEICKNATLLGMHEKKLQAMKLPNLRNESYQTLEKSPETKSTEDQAIKPPNLPNESYQTLEKSLQTKTTGAEDQAIKPPNLPNESHQTLEKSPQTKSAEDQRGVSLKLANKRHREEVSQLQKKLCLKATTFEPQNKICKTSSTEQPHINQDQVSESLIMQSEGFKNALLSDSSGKVSEHGLSSAFNHERAQTTKQVLMKNVACQTEEEFLESHIKKDITTVFTNVQNEKIQVVKHLALKAKQNRKRSPKPDVLPNTNIMLSRCLLKKAPNSEFIKQNCQAFADRKLQYKSLPTHSPTEIQPEEAETESQPFIKNVRNRRHTPQLQSETSEISKVLEPQNKQFLIEIASSSQNDMDQVTTSLELQNKFISQQPVLSSSTQNKNAQSVSSSELQEEKCEIIEQKHFSNKKIQEVVSNQVTVKQTSSEMINEIYLCKINCDTPAFSGNTAYCTNISPLSALHGSVENVNPPGNYRNICTGFITSQVYNIRQSVPAMLDHEVPHSSLIISENHFDSCENHDNLERVNLNMNNYVIANQIAYPIVCENINITSFHNTDPSMLMHPYSYGSHEIFLNPVCTALINPSGLINNYCHFGGLLLSKENCANVCLSSTNIRNVCKPSASSTDLNEFKRS